MLLLSLTLKLPFTHCMDRRGGVGVGVNNSCILLHIYHQLYKNSPKLDPFSCSCRVQLVTGECVLKGGFNFAHVALPVQHGFEDFMWNSCCHTHKTQTMKGEKSGREIL